MSTTSPNVSRSTDETRSQASSGKSVTWKSIALPYVIAIVAQLPMLLLYCRNLFLDKPHYQTFPFAFLATAAIAYFRWPREAKMPFHRSTFSDLLLILGLLFAFACVLFKFPSAAAASVMLLIASLLARTVDAETLKSLWPASLPMFVFLTLPAGLDVWLITWLQRISAICTSRLLDLVGLGHHMNGTVIEVPGFGSYGIEQACSGVQSFFTLLFVAVVFIVAFRRPFFRGLMLVASAVFWALFMNTVRIFLIPVMDQAGIDLSHGFPHALLGWSTMLVGVLMLLSTDQFLLFLFGPVDSEAGRAGPFGKSITKAWNGLIAGGASDGDVNARKRKKRGRKSISAAGQTVIWSICGLLTLMGLWSSFDVFSEFTNERQSVRFFDVDVVRPFEEGDLPAKLGGWSVLDYSIDTRERGSDLGKRSDLWQYRAPNCRASVSLDQPFPGWHELTTCYQNSGWRLLKRERKVAKIDATGENGESFEQTWPYVVAEFDKPTGEHGFLVFSLFNSSGNPVDPPNDWNRISGFIERLKNRLSGRIRSSLFNNSTYQIQTFVGSFGIDDQTREDIETQFLKVREITREKFMEKQSATTPAS